MSNLDTNIKPEVIIYSDGACSGNPGPGGWGALLQYGQSAREIYGHEINTTNNRMEMHAVIQALKVLKSSCHVRVYTDSRYLQQGITIWIHKWLKNNWRTSDKNPVKNVDLWQELYAEINKHEIIWAWVKGHSDNIGNNIADKLANIGKNTAIELLKCAS